MSAVSVNLVYCLGTARAPERTETEGFAGAVSVGLLVNTTTGVIEDVHISIVGEQGKRFVESLVRGRRVSEANLILQELNSRFFSTTKPAVLAAFSRACRYYSTRPQAKLPNL